MIMSLTVYVYASLRQRFSVYAFLTEDVLVISQTRNKEHIFFKYRVMEWLDVSFEEEIVTTTQHDPKRTVDMVMHIIMI